MQRTAERWLLGGRAAARGGHSFRTWRPALDRGSPSHPAPMTARKNIFVTTAPLPSSESAPESEIDPLLSPPDQATQHWMAPAVEEEVERESIRPKPVPEQRIAPSAKPRRVLDYFASFRSRKQFGSLDGLRALSILGVVWH